MEIEVENYIKAKMKRARARWDRAYKKYVEGNMQDAANMYADAMRLYYECATDLIAGIGFSETKGETK